jgi:hypothetical protein
VRLIRTEKQRENLARFFWDLAKAAFGIFFAGPLASEGAGSSRFAVGLVVAFTLGVVAYIIDGREVRR